MPWPIIGAAARIGGHIIKKNLPGLGRAIAGKSGAAKKAAAAAGKIAAGGAVFEAGGRVARKVFGDDGPERKRRRSINVGNVRALRRAMSRVQGFAKLAKKTISFTKSTKMKSKRRSR